MDMIDFKAFIRPELLILVAFLWVIGLVLKKHPKFKAEWTIPFILVGLGILVAILYVGFVVDEAFTAGGITTSVVQGVLVAGLAVLINEGVKQAFIKRKDGSP